MKTAIPTRARSTATFLKNSVVLSDSDVEGILDGIADFRGSPVDWDYGEDGSDSFAAFIDELEREDRAEDLKSFGF